MPKSTMSRRADGRFQKSITDPKTGKRIYFYGTTEREVNRKILDYEEKCENGKTFAEVAGEWWREALEVISPTSVRGYRVAMEYAVKYFGDIYVKDITARDISRYLAKLASLGYAKSTVKNYKIVVSRIFHYALINGYVDFSPTVGVDIPRGLKQKRRTAAVEGDEEIIRRSAKMWIAPYLALMTGLRKGELLALQWKDVDFKRNVISVSKSLYYKAGAHIKEPKTESGKRIVPILKPLREELLARHEEIAPSPEHYVVSDTGEKPLSQKRFRTLEKHFREDSGVTSTLHQLRKSFATIAVKAKLEPKVLQSIMGHKNIATTYNIYAEVREDSIAAAGDALSDLLK